jgi:hypothetical protein
MVSRGGRTWAYSRVMMRVMRVLKRLRSPWYSWMFGNGMIWGGK